MQQTDKYQLNLIETSDTFSPAPLNENAQKLEAALDAARAEAAAADAALDQRVQAFEAKHFAYGSYTPQSKRLDIDLGFQPAIVLVMAYGNTHSEVLMADVGGYTGGHSGGVTPNGFWVKAASSTGSITIGGLWYGYFAFG